MFKIQTIIWYLSLMAASIASDAETFSKNGDGKKHREIAMIYYAPSSDANSEDDSADYVDDSADLSAATPHSVKKSKKSARPPLPKKEESDSETASSETESSSEESATNEVDSVTSVHSGRERLHPPMCIEASTNLLSCIAAPFPSFCKNDDILWCFGRACGIALNTVLQVLCCPICIPVDVGVCCCCVLGGWTESCGHKEEDCPVTKVPKSDFLMEFPE